MHVTDLSCSPVCAVCPWQQHLAFVEARTDLPTRANRVSAPDQPHVSTRAALCVWEGGGGGRSRCNIASLLPCRIPDGDPNHIWGLWPGKY